MYNGTTHYMIIIPDNGVIVQRVHKQIYKKQNVHEYTDVKLNNVNV